MPGLTILLSDKHDADLFMSINCSASIALVLWASNISGEIPSGDVLRAEWSLKDSLFMHFVLSTEGLKLKFQISYSTSRLARFLGWSTLHPRITAMWLGKQLQGDTEINGNSGSRVRHFNDKFRHLGNDRSPSTYNWNNPAFTGLHFHEYWNDFS